jgi:hypothetical protein
MMDIDAAIERMITCASIRCLESRQEACLAVVQWAKARREEELESAMAPNPHALLMRAYYESAGWEHGIPWPDSD